MKKRIGLFLSISAFALAATVSNASSVNSLLPSDEMWVLTPSTNNWLVDRYAPDSFNMVEVSGVPGENPRPALQIGIDPADDISDRPPGFQIPFYNTQGFQTPSGLATNEDWTVEGSLLVTSDLTNGSPNPFRSDIWAKTGIPNSENMAQYFIMGLFVGDTNLADADPGNAAPINSTATWRVWDDANNIWHLIDSPVTNGWNAIRIAEHQQLVEYYLNGALVYTETNIKFPSYLESLATVFIEAYNFGGPAYTATWGSDWAVDRYPTASITTTNVNGTPAWNLGVDPSGFQGAGSFDDYQGYQTPAKVSPNNHWAVHADLYVQPDVASGAFSPVNESLWVDTSDDQGPEDFFIIGLFSGDAMNRTNPNPVMPTVSWEIFNDNSGQWEYLPTPVTSGWHELRISQDNGGIYYYIDSNLVFQVTGSGIGVPDAISNLDTVFLETYNFGGPAYEATWSDLVTSDLSKPFLPSVLTITTITLSTQPGFSAELQSITNLVGNEIWTPIADAPVVDGTLKYQFFRASVSP